MRAAATADVDVNGAQGAEEPDRRARATFVTPPAFDPLPWTPPPARA